MNPNFFIVGAPKSGTTNISYHLNSHPQVFMPDDLEPYYFARFDVPKNYRRYVIRDKKKYLDMFKNAKNCIAVGESSPVYLFCPRAPKDIKDHFPDAKIIICLRNPIEITHSMYFSLQFMRFDLRSLEEILDESEIQIEDGIFDIDNLILPGFYSQHIKKYQNIFPRDNIKIIIFEEYIKNIQSNIESIFTFLGIHQRIELKEQPKGAYRIPKNNFSKMLLNNTAFRRFCQFLIPTTTRQKIGDRYFVNEGKKPDLLPSQRERLRDIFEPEVRNLEKLLDRKLPWDDFIRSGDRY